MLNREKGVFVLSALVLVLLYLMSSTDLIFKESEAQIYPVSVIIEDANDEYYQNFKKGMEQAARAYNVDINFISLYTARDHGQQMELLDRELEDGARAVILSPVSGEQTLLKLEEKKQVVPVVLLHTQSTSDWVSANVTMDYEEAGALLGRAFAERHDASVPVYLLTTGLDFGSNRRFYGGVAAELSSAGFQMTVLTDVQEDEIAAVLEKEGAAVIALDEPSLDTAAAAAEKGEPEQLAGLYGIGSSVSFLNALDNGVIDGLIVSNEFNAGYLSVRAAVEGIRSGVQREEVKLESFYIEKEQLRDPEYEKMLYPME